MRESSEVRILLYSTMILMAVFYTLELSNVS